MMNLELLTWSAREAKEPWYREVAVTHATVNLDIGLFDRLSLVVLEGSLDSGERERVVSEVLGERLAEATGRFSCGYSIADHPLPDGGCPGGAASREMYVRTYPDPLFQSL
jgi:hypothetical protein